MSNNTGCNGKPNTNQDKKTDGFRVDLRSTSPRSPRNEHRRSTHNILGSHAYNLRRYSRYISFSVSPSISTPCATMPKNTTTKICLQPSGLFFLRCLVIRIGFTILSWSIHFRSLYSMLQMLPCEIGTEVFWVEHCNEYSGILHSIS